MKISRGLHLSHLLGALVEEQPQNDDVHQRHEEGGVRVELLLLHERVGAVAEVEVRHDHAHAAQRLERRREPRGPRGRGGLPLLQALHVRGHWPVAVAAVAHGVEPQQHQRAAQEDARRQLLQQAGGPGPLTAGAVDGPRPLVAYRVHEEHGPLGRRTAERQAGVRLVQMSPLATAYSRTYGVVLVQQCFCFGFV